MELEGISKVYLLNGPNSAPTCLRALKLIIERTGAKRIDESLTRGWFELARTHSRCATDPAEQQRILRTAVSTFNQARAVFAAGPLEAMERAGVLPRGVDGFLGSAKKYAPKLAPPPANVPAEAAVKLALAQWREWPNDPEKANDFIAVGLMLSCGLRKGEVSQARRNWFTERSGRVVVHAASVRVKNQSGELTVVPLNPFWEQFQAGLARLQPSATADEWLLSGSETERCDLVFRRIGEWLRGLGWRTQKTNHAFRDYSASLITMKWGLTYAKAWCRHRHIATTERSYSRFVDPVMMLQQGPGLDWVSFA